MERKKALSGTVTWLNSKKLRIIKEKSGRIEQPVTQYKPRLGCTAENLCRFSAAAIEAYRSLMQCCSRPERTLCTLLASSHIESLRSSHAATRRPQLRLAGTAMSIRRGSSRSSAFIWSIYACLLATCSRGLWRSSSPIVLTAMPV